VPLEDCGVCSDIEKLGEVDWTESRKGGPTRLVGFGGGGSDGCGELGGMTGGVCPMEVWFGKMGGGMSEQADRHVRG